jgi:hypothetical protein
MTQLDFNIFVTKPCLLVDNIYLLLVLLDKAAHSNLQLSLNCQTFVSCYLIMVLCTSQHLHTVYAIYESALTYSICHIRVSTYIQCIPYTSQHLHTTNAIYESAHTCIICRIRVSSYMHYMPYTSQLLHTVYTIYESARTCSICQIKSSDSNSALSSNYFITLVPFNPSV